MSIDVAGFAYVTCCDLKCGVGYYIPRYMHTQAVDNGRTRTLYCPNGHSWIYTRSEADGLRDRVTSLEKELIAQRDCREKNWQEVVKQQRLVAYWKGIVTRLKAKKS